MAYKRASNEMFIEGAIKTVAAVGIENTRTKDVAEYAGFSEATLFRHYPTKEALLKAAFLYVDKQLSNILTTSKYIRNPDGTPFQDVLHQIWREVFQYLLDNPEETIFLIRYRYSALYTNEVRSQREAYNGAFVNAYKAFEGHFGQNRHSYQGFLINYIFELTLCFAEKIVQNKVVNTPEVELLLWRAINAAVRELMQMKD